MAAQSNTYVQPHMGKESKASTLAEGIRLQPIKMSEIIAAAPVNTPKETGNKYVPPSLRKTDLVTQKNTMAAITDTDFPSLALASKVIQPKKQVTISPNNNFKKLIDKHLEIDKLNNSGQAPIVKNDAMKLTKAQLEADGWAVLSLKREESIKKEHCEEETILVDDIHRVKRFSKEVEEEMEQFFENYLKQNLFKTPTFNFVKKIKSKTPLNDACMRYRAKHTAKC
jgi:hypothetical protein